MTSSLPPLTRGARRSVEEALDDTPCVVIQGARQVGKSTLADQLTRSRGGRMVTFDDPAVLAAARLDPRSFLTLSHSLLTIDEVQRYPEILRMLKLLIDEDRRPGRFLLTGSADLLSLPGTESLAGRAETVTLLPLSQGEIRGEREQLLDRALAGDRDWFLETNSTLVRSDYAELICRGGYPRVVLGGPTRHRAWFASYIERIVLRDARDVSRLAHLDRLPALLATIAATNTTEAVNSRLALDAGIPESSFPPYLQLLQSLGLIQLVPSWGRNLRGRLVRRPKVHLLDTGLASALIGVRAADLAPGPGSDLAGPLFESFVAAELRKQLEQHPERPTLHHFRDRNGLEVDLILERGPRSIVAIEVKASSSVGDRDLRGLRAMRDELGDSFSLGLLLHSGPEALPYGDRIVSAPISALWHGGIPL